MVMQMRHRSEVEGIFDDYADEFEEHLVTVLRYGIPGLIREKLQAVTPCQFRRCLDLGCGTGLAGRELRSMISERLEGVDLSKPMLDKAALKGGYDALHKQDAVMHLKRLPSESFDLIVAADMLIYVAGGLEPLFKQVSRVLSADGIFVFSTEAAEEEEAPGGIVENEDSERFAFTRSYLTKVSAAFRPLYMEAVTVRFEADKPVTGDLCVLQK